MVDGSEEAARGRQICGERQGCHGRKIFVGARGVGELDSYRVNTALGYVVVELLDGAFGLHTLVKANEANPLGEAFIVLFCNRSPLSVFIALSASSGRL